MFPRTKRRESNGHPVTDNNPMATLQINLHKPGKNEIIGFAAVLLRSSAEERVVQAEWTRPRLDLGYMVFEPGDRFIEHYYANRWYTIYAIYHAADQHNLKGWYCNIARPAVWNDVAINSEDLELDLFVSPDYQTILTLDRDEYDARGFVDSEPATHHAALAALAELQRMAQERRMPEL